MAIKRRGSTASGKSTRGKKMGGVRKRSSRAPEQETTKRKGKASERGWMRKGRAGFDQADVERQEQEKRRAANANAAFRFWLKEGDEADIIILDTDLDEVPFLYEHQFEVDGKWGNFELCVSEWDHCAVCEVTDRRPYYAMYLSILDLREYTNRQGKKIPHSKKLLCVKTSAMNQLQRLCQAAMKKHGTIRGMHLVLSRDSNSDTNIGVPTMIDDDGTLYEVISEDDLVAEFGHKAVKGRDGKVLKPEDADITPYDYDKVFPKPDADELRERYGGKAKPGSKRDIDNELEEEEYEDEEDEAEEEEAEDAEDADEGEDGDEAEYADEEEEEDEDGEEEAEEDDGDEDGDEDEDGEEDEEEDEPEEEEEEEKPKPRARARARARPKEDEKPAGKTRRRAKPSEAEAPPKTRKRAAAGSKTESKKTGTRKRGTRVPGKNPF